MALNYAELELLVRELSPVLTGGVIIQATQTAPDEVVVEIRHAAANYSLLIKLHHKLCFMATGKPFTKPPLSPYNFTASLRKELVGLKIESIVQKPRDRIVYFDCGVRQLILELTGRNGNLFLTDRDERIINCLFKRDGEKRKEIPGERYRILSMTSDREFTPRADLMNAPGNSLGEKIYRFYLKASTDDKLLAEKEEYAAQLDKTVKFIKRLQKDKELASAFDTEKERGDALLSSFGSWDDVDMAKAVKKGEMTYEVMVDNPVKGFFIPVLLNRMKTIPENAEGYYESYKKMKKRYEELTMQLANATIEKEKNEFKLHEIETKLFRLKSGELTTSELLGEKRERFLSTAEKKHRDRDEQVHLFATQSGKTLVLGKHARSNLHVLKRYGRGNFWWFHARDWPGPFVILQADNVTGTDIADAASFALYFSKGRNAGKGNVIYTRCKYVRPIPKSEGKVTYSQDSNIFIEPDNDAMKKMMKGIDTP